MKVERYLFFYVVAVMETDTELFGALRSMGVSKPNYLEEYDIYQPIFEYDEVEILKCLIDAGFIPIDEKFRSETQNWLDGCDCPKVRSYLDTCHLITFTS